MADRPERTSAEREAARLDRERRRAQRSRHSFAEPEPATVEAAQPETSTDAATDRTLRADPADGDHDHTGDRELDREHEPDNHDHAGGYDLDGAGDDSGDHDLDGDYETDEHEVEVPSGTRRVSHLETLSSGRKRKPLRKAPRKPARGPRKKHSWKVRAASLLALLAAGALIWFLIELFQPLHSSPHGHVTVVIPHDATSGQIGDLLARDGVIPSSFFFELRATLDGDRGDLRSGVYHLQQGMTYSAVLDKLTTAPPAAKVTNLTITEGRTRHEINALLKAQHVHGSYLGDTRSSPSLNYRRYGLRHPPKTLEGFLFPDTYQLVEPVKIPALVDDQLRAFKQNFAKVDLGYARRKHLTPYDVLTIASLIEAEAATKHDRPLVASVIYNRLADGMALQLDSTTRFATGNYTRPLTESQLHSSSPYNTRTHVGLPPGPIDNPGMAAIQAAAHPAHSNYLFFFTRPCGRSAVFASNYAQFLAQGSQHVNKHC
jgi:uncharacterized YceG family protein